MLSLASLLTLLPSVADSFPPQHLLRGIQLVFNAHWLFASWETQLVELIIVALDVLPPSPLVAVLSYICLSG